MKNKITQQDIDEIIKNGTLTVETIGENTTMVRFVTKDGYEIIETSACVDKANYNEAIGAEICRKRIEDKLWAYEGYLLQKELAKANTDCMSFGKAIEALKAGNRVARKGWNGKGIYLELQKPDEHSKMSLPYIYIVTNSLVSENPDAPRGVVPWLASQTDMLCEDWVIV